MRVRDARELRDEAATAQLDRDEADRSCVQSRADYTDPTMADIIRFEPLGPPGNPNWRRFPRFDEVGAQIDAQASKIFDTRVSLARGTELYARVEQKLPPSDRTLLRDLYQAITRHHERYEHAAYLVGLQAGAGKLQGLPALDDQRSPDAPKRA
jgi:hypothetical protein